MKASSHLAGYGMSMAKTFEHLESASKRLAVVMPATRLIIAGVLFLVLRSMRDAAVIFSGVPLVLMGVFSLLVLPALYRMSHQRSPLRAPPG